MKIIMFSGTRLLLAIFLFISSIAAVPPHLQNSEKAIKPTLDVLDELGGVPCFDWSFFTCITVDVPLDHFNPSDTRTIPVVFAVLPASGTRKGMFVTATGGPGTSGVLLADYYSSGFDPSILESFDIVFFDQRGMALSGGLTCPQAATVYYLHDGRAKSRKQETALKEAASMFSRDCVSELSNPDLLPYLGTAQAVEDLEFFRQLIGDEQFWLYGESYGTQYAQTYAAKHGEHLAGLILDGTVDLTLNGFEFYTQYAQAFNDVLTATLSFCNDDPFCKQDLNGNALKAYDNLARKLKDRPISFRFPLANGRFETRKFTFSNLEFVAASQLYAEGDRMIFNRALAAYASHKDLAPLARLLYLSLGLDPQTLEIIADDSYSDAIFYGVECQDYGYPGNTPEEKAQNYLQAGNAVEDSISRLASVFYGDMPCAYWPDPTSNLTRPAPLTAEGIPTLVLGATADPATPVNQGISVYQRLTDAYLLIQQGGPHVIFGRGNECPDALVTDFLVNDVVPAQRETTCEGVLADDYVPLAPRAASRFTGPLEALASAETEIAYLPEYYYWDGFTPTSTGCTLGGILNFKLNQDETKYKFTLENCAFTRNFVMTGIGNYDPDQDRFVLDITTKGRWQCDLKYIRNVDRLRITGKCNGKPIQVEEQDDAKKIGIPVQEFQKPTRSR